MNRKKNASLSVTGVAIAALSITPTNSQGHTPRKLHFRW